MFSHNKTHTAKQLLCQFVNGLQIGGKGFGFGFEWFTFGVGLDVRVFAEFEFGFGFKVKVFGEFEYGFGFDCDWFGIVFVGLVVNEGVFVGLDFWSSFPSTTS